MSAGSQVNVHGVRDYVLRLASMSSVESGGKSGAIYRHIAIARLIFFREKRGAMKTFILCTWSVKNTV